MKIKAYFSSPLGMGNQFAPNRKEWIQLALAGASLASSLLGGASASNASKKAEAEQRNEKAKEDAMYNRKRNERYVDTEAGQNLLRRANEAYQRNINRIRGQQSVTGGTDAAAAMAKEQANKAVGDTIADMAAIDTQRRDNADAQQVANDQKHMQMNMQREMQRAQQITQAAQGASNAMMSAAGALGASEKTPNLNGGDNNGTPVTQPSGNAVITGTPDPITAEQAIAQGVDADLVNKVRRVNG